ncbi:hypothetical protein BC826DRAFT_521975 [Russula brevipes]|nr:hypothetical protein BC826DRAFT_521975 [Russula brevipes]
MIDKQFFLDLCALTRWCHKPTMYMPYARKAFASLPAFIVLHKAPQCLVLGAPGSESRCIYERAHVATFLPSAGGIRIVKHEAIWDHLACLQVARSLFLSPLLQPAGLLNTAAPQNSSRCLRLTFKLSLIPRPSLGSARQRNDWRLCVMRYGKFWQNCLGRPWLLLSLWHGRRGLSMAPTC